MVTCAKCHESYADAVKFCPRDGTPLSGTTVPADQTPRQCPQCGAKYKGQKFCIHDGAVLEAAS